MAERYDWKDNAFITGDAQQVGEELTEIVGGAGGAVDPRQLWTTIRDNPDSAIYMVFDRYGAWDDRVAADRWRDELARRVIRSIRVVREVDGHDIKVIEYVHVKTEERENKYVTVADVMTNEDYHTQMLKDALTLLEGVRRRYEHLTELRDVFVALERVARRRLAARRRRERRAQPRA